MTGDMRSAGVVQVLDVGCGVASFSSYLLPLDIQTMSFAPKDGRENQIQFSLERGLGAMTAAIATKQLPYPSSSFKMVHCSRCCVDCYENGMVLEHCYARWHLKIVCRKKHIFRISASCSSYILLQCFHPIEVIIVSRKK